jgi:hypothetical protein
VYVATSQFKEIKPFDMKIEQLIKPSHILFDKISIDIDPTINKNNTYSNHL